MLGLRRARRVLAALLLVAAVPTLLAAGLPLKLCKSLAGHQALEYVVKGQFHGGRDPSHSSNDRLVVAHKSLEMGIGKTGCNDVDLTDVTTPPEAPKPVALLVATALPDPFPLAVYSPPNSAIPALAGKSRIDPRVAGRRTLVLRI